ncbi:MAG: hypothetical protein RLY86_1156 [Pseudomonadota bacterium]|jgi:hypothetical protein
MTAYLSWLAAAGDLWPPGDGARAGEAAPDPGTGLVIGCAVGYGVDDVAPFVKSLRAVTAGPAALIVAPDPAMAAFLAAHDVAVVEATAPGEFANTYAPHIVVARFLYSVRALDLFPGAGRALLTDVRDVVFQADPFAEATAPLCFFLEDEPNTLATNAEGINLRWLARVLGRPLADRFADRGCVCVGTVLGDRDAILAFCRQSLLLAAIPRAEVARTFGFGVDQATCNLIAHGRLIPGGVVHPNYGMVATVGRTPAAGLTLGPDGRVRNPDGTVSPILHQYDRHPHLLAEVVRRWGSTPVAGLYKQKKRKTAGQRLLTSLRKRLPELR